MIDASAAVELLRGSAVGRALGSRLAVAEITLHAPQILEIEILHVLRRLVRTSELDAWRANQAVADLSELAVEQYPPGPLLGRIWELRDNLSAYDAAYVALAEALDAPLLTLDARLARAPGHRARVEVLAA